MKILELTIIVEKLGKQRLYKKYDRSRLKVQFEDLKFRYNL